MAASSSSSTPLPLPVSVKEVYNYNFAAMFQEFMNVAAECTIIACDTEFSGLTTRAPVYTGAYDVYEQMKGNIESARLVQIGFAFSDSDGNVLCAEDAVTPVVWHFNIKFDMDVDPYVEAAIDKLIESDINFNKHKTDGIPCSEFVEVFVPWLMDISTHSWVVFHGNYDLGLLMTNFLKKAIPDHILEFGCVLDGYFGKKVYDVKTMAARCRLFYVSQSLPDYAACLEVPFYGTKHQAGSDALVTLLVYHKIKTAKPAESAECVNDLYQLWPC